jgi:ABC-type branched-subunit amino acid transport system substrate-binding protein
MPKLLLSLLLVVLSACAAPKRVVKIALVAPFEGRLRQVGYDTFAAMRLAIRDEITTGGANNVMVSFVAYNDNGDPATAQQVARNIALDPDVVAVIGHWVPTTTLAALRVYTEANLPLLVPGIPANVLPHDKWVFRMGPARQNQTSNVNTETCEGGSFAIHHSAFGTCLLDAPPVAELPNAATALAGFSDITLGTPPAPRSIVAFDATNVVIAAIRADAADGAVTRAGVADALRHVKHTGLLGTITFDAVGMWPDARLWVYRH